MKNPSRQKENQLSIFNTKFGYLRHNIAVKSNPKTPTECSHSQGGCPHFFSQRPYNLVLSKPFHVHVHVICVSMDFAKGYFPLCVLLQSINALILLQVAFPVSLSRFLELFFVFPYFLSTVNLG